MDKVLIIGTYDFLGFAICTKLLEKGYQVVGYHKSVEDQEQFLEEKKMLIGRNANFEENSSLADLVNVELANDEATIVWSLYDEYHSRNEDPLDREQLKIWLETKKESKIKLVLLCPLDFLNNWPPSLDFEKNRFSLQTIFIPTLYGPWQSANLYFQQHLLKAYTNLKIKFDEREQASDAIFIDDAAEVLIELLNSFQTEDLLLQSELGENWRRCADFLKIDLPKENNEKIDVGNVTIKKVPCKTSIKQGLDQQRQHLEGLLKNY